MLAAFIQIAESKITNYKNVNLLTHDIYYYINESIKRFVDQNFLQFEQSQRITDNLSPLVVKEVIIPTSHTPPSYNTDWLIDRIELNNLSKPFLYLLNQKVEMEVARVGNYLYKITAGSRVAATLPQPYTDFSTLTRRLRTSQHDDIHTMLRDPHNKSTSEYPLATVSNTGIDVYTDKTFIAKQVILDYLHQPTEVNTDKNSELPEYTHREIVEMAVNMFIINQTNEE